MTLEDVATFLLTKPPLDELTDELADVVERYRYHTIDKQRATEMLIENNEQELQHILDTNLEIVSLLN
jgi:hypothetical protein